MTFDISGTYPGNWLPGPSLLSPSRLAIARWCLRHIGVYETEPPIKSHRGPDIDNWNANCGAPLGSLWCAAFAVAAWQSGGVTPLGNGACASWYRNAVAQRRLTANPEIGDVVLYCFDDTGVAHHCGVVVRTAPQVLTVEGDTDDGGAPNGVGVFLRDRKGSGVLGYCSVGV